MRKNCNITRQDSVGEYQRKISTVCMFGEQNFQTENSQPTFLGENPGYDSHFSMLRGLSVLKSQQDYAPVDSPTLTTNSERSEITEASTDFSFLGGSQQLVRGQQQQLDTAHFQSMQQSAYNMQLLQQQMMFKQMQDIQRQQFDDARQQGQYASYINGTSVSESSDMFVNRAHLGASSAAQGAYNQLMVSQDKGPTFHPTLLVPQQLDEYNYRTPISSGRSGMGQYSQLQGMDRDSCNLLNKATMQPVAFSGFSSGNINTVSDHFSFSQMGRSKQGFQAKKLFDQIPIQGMDAGMRSGNVQLKNYLETNGSFPEFQGGQDGAGWLGTTQQKLTQLDASQFFVPLDPVEQNLLYNMDNNMWDTSLEKCTNVGDENFENNLVQSDYSNAFSSGSWSALMQSAVAEASSSDTGIQEEWSGLTFQNTELSTENLHSNIVDSKKEQSAWFENGIHSASSLSSRPYANFNDSGMSSSFPGFQQSGNQPSIGNAEHLYLEDSYELNQNPSEKTGEWRDNKSSQKQLGDQSQHVQPLEHLNKSLASQIYEQVEYDKPPQQLTTSHDNINQPHGKPQGDSFSERLQQKDSSRDQYMLNQLSSQGQGHFQRSYLFDVSSNAMNLEKGQLAGFEGNIKSSVGTPRGNMDSSTNFCKPNSLKGQNPVNQTSENVHGHLQNVDQSKENSATPHYSTVGSSGSMMAEAVFRNPSVFQHHNQSTSQDFPMSLRHPSQQLSNFNKISPSQGLPQLSSNLDIRPVNSGLVQKSQIPVTPSSSIHSMPPLNKSLQNGNWDENLHGLGEAEAATSLFLQPDFVTDENQGQFASGASAERLSPQHSFASASRYPVFEANPISQPLSISRIGQQGGLLAKQQNVWLNNASQQHNAPSNKIGSLNNALEVTSLPPQGFNVQTSQRFGLRLSETDMIAKNSQDFGHKNEILEQRTKSDVYAQMPSLADGVANAFPFSLLPVHPHQQGLNRVEVEEKNGLTISERDSLFHNFSKLPRVVDQQYAQEKVKALKNVEIEPEGVQDAQQVTTVSKGNSREDPKHGQGFTSEINSMPSENKKMQNLFAGGRDDYRAKPMSENPPNTCSKGFNRKNIEGNNEENSQINSLIASSWFKLKNGQMPPMHNELLSKLPGEHFSLLKSSENLCKQSSLDGLDSVDVSQSGRAQSSVPTTMVAPGLTGLHGLTSPVTVKTEAIVRPKKRKFDSSELRPWHLEVQGSQRIVNVSVSEQDWAQTTNRLSEKMVNEVEIVEDGRVRLRSKRRLIMTTQLLQQLVCPAPSFILSADASSFYDSTIYFVLRSSLGETCSLMSGQRNDLRMSLDNRNVTSEEHETVKCTDDKYISEAVESFCTRAEKLENDLQRLDRTASIVDLMVECQELERFSVINRFAKFHIRQAELSGNASSNGSVTLAPKLYPQRYVTAHPISSHLPEGVQCLSL